ncbi:glycine cleavage system aminomethyltransferase GcvT [Salimicrobium halophilum]|uniref:Aminomethyltransferase n=1 Tax=Salimicrobium halophilum TaxID=86666 RepID=A0A1G8PTN7_9BACI|nr:glycine cleavage system aminomethyltransferase GcvT [Salimicrobium halophilum]SDI95813.1 aminomethyltransferase [Salimicrobium halophilum]
MTKGNRSPLHSEFVRMGAKLINFGGWDMPVQFSGIKEEHRAVREKAGLFDVSHMGEIIVRGTSSVSFLNKMLTNDVEKLTPGKAQYTIMCQEDGGTVDDLIVYHLKENEYLLVVNAANKEKDLQWLVDHNEEGAEVVDYSEHYAQLAIQGPRAEKILQSITGEKLEDIRFFRFHQEVTFEGVEGKAIVSRTGYTGEDGFEIYLPADAAVDLWRACLESGKEDGLEPVGLGARDTLRFEAALPLYSQELSASISPIEAGLGFAVKVKKETDFMGKEVLQRQKENGVDRKLVGIEMIEKGIPRHGYTVYDDKDREIGFVTSGTQSPSLQKNLGLALLDQAYTDEGQHVYVQVRKKRLEAKVVPKPFFKR